MNKNIKLDKHGRIIPESDNNIVEKAVDSPVYKTEAVNSNCNNDVCSDDWNMGPCSNDICDGMTNSFSCDNGTCTAIAGGVGGS